MLTHVSTRLVGGMCGRIWWPVGTMCGRPINLDLRREADRFTEAPDLRCLLIHVQMQEGGDFQAPYFTGDTEIVVTFRDHARGRTVTRSRPLLSLRSGFDLSDLVVADVYSHDIEAEDA